MDPLQSHVKLTPGTAVIPRPVIAHDSPGGNL
jgi:hypothetical protein